MRTRLLIAFIALIGLPGRADQANEDQFNQNAIALTQAFLTFPASYIGGVPLDQRREFLSLVSHYGDINFAQGIFRLRGDGARASDSPSSRHFEMMIVPRESQMPLCLIAAEAGAEKPLIVVSFEDYWRWEDVTQAYLPKEIVLDSSVDCLLPDPGGPIVLRETYKRVSGGREVTFLGPMRGTLSLSEGQLAYEPFDYEKFMVSAIKTVPPQFFADIPLQQREAMLRQIADNPEQLDRENGWLHWFSDQSAEISASSMIWAKVLKRTEGEPYFFVHLPKPYADGKPPRPGQTFVLAREEDGWIDKTNLVLPKQLDPTAHFRTRRDDVIEVASWEEFERSDGLGVAVRFGDRFADLIWNLKHIQVKEAESDELTNN